MIWDRNQQESDLWLLCSPTLRIFDIDLYLFARWRSSSIMDLSLSLDLGHLQVSTCHSRKGKNKSFRVYFAVTIGILCARVLLAERDSDDQFPSKFGVLNQFLLVSNDHPFCPLILPHVFLCHVEQDQPLPWLSSTDQPSTMNGPPWGANQRCPELTPSGPGHLWGMRFNGAS